MTAPSSSTSHRRSGRPVPRPGPRPAAGFDVDPAESRQQAEPAADAAQTAPERPRRTSRATSTREASASTQRRAHATGTRGASKPASGALDKRLNLILTTEQRRWLMQGRVDDDIDANSRIRAMIQLWHTDKELRERVDQLAHEMRG